jgi:chromosome partitioning protein
MSKPKCRAAGPAGLEEMQDTPETPDTSELDRRGVGRVRVIQRPPTDSYKIVVANSKGGCGKTTMATNLAAWFAKNGRTTALIDFDSQESSTFWLEQRPVEAAPIVGISAAGKQLGNQTRSFQNRMPRQIERVIVDTPAGLVGDELYRTINNADMVVVPILPSPIDIHSVSSFIRDIHISGYLRDRNKQVLVVANRARRNTVMFAKLNQFLRELGLPSITYTRDSQLYHRAAAQGLGIADIANSQAKEEKVHWTRIGNWIEARAALRAQRRAGQAAQQARRLSR